MTKREGSKCTYPNESNRSSTGRLSRRQSSLRSSANAVGRMPATITGSRMTVVWNPDLCVFLPAWSDADSSSGVVELKELGGEQMQFHGQESGQ